MRPIERIALLCALAALAYACDSDKQVVGPGASRALRADASGVPFTEGLASPAWQELARNFIMQSTLSGNSAKATRVYAYLSVAQYDAVVRAEDAIGGSESETDLTRGDGLGSGGRSPLEVDRGAVAGAAAAGLSFFRSAHSPRFGAKGEQQAKAGTGSTGEPTPSIQ